MKNVLIPTKLNGVAKELLEQKGFCVVHDSDTSLAELAAQNPDTEALIVRSDKVTAEIIDALPKLRLVVRAGAGYNTIDVKHARRRGVDVMNTPGANANGVAEEVFALALAAYRNVVPADVSTRAGRWEKKSFMGRELCGKTLGIMGLGNIGQLVAKRADGFDMKLIGYDPIISAAKAASAGVELVDLQTLFSESDIITLHIPETDETRGMINASLLSLMKDEALLVNCARAGIIDEDDLRRIKAEKNLLFANDVYAADEAGDKSVADIADVMLPHLGASTQEANYNAAHRAAEQIIEYVEKGVTRFVVNKGVPDELDAVYQKLAYHVALVARSYLGADKPVSHVCCSFYGELEQYAKWFLPPVCAALGSDFGPGQDPEEAVQYLKERGIELEVRDTDNAKGYGNSMTIDLVQGSEALCQVSVRGTVTEGNQMISRINDFKKLYFEPKGHSLIVVYEDRPGVLAQITSACAAEDINIDDIRAPRNSDGKTAIAVLMTNKAVPQTVVESVRESVDASVAFALSIG